MAKLQARAVSFGQFSYAVRSAAINLLASRGVFTWSATFNPNSEAVLSVCHQIANGETPDIASDPALYAWSASDVLAYQNDPARGHAKRKPIRSYKAIPVAGK